MTDKGKSIRAHKELIWHLTCGGCGNYWTYPTMQLAEDITKKPLHCPLCGIKQSVIEDNGLAS